MKFKRLAGLFLGLLMTLAIASPSWALFYNPCQESGNPAYQGSAPQSSVSLSASGATTQAIAPVTGTGYYICGGVLTIAASTTGQLEYGTGATCGTGTVVLTGALNPGIVPLPYMFVPAGFGLCLVATGATAVTGVIQYVVAPGAGSTP